ncbi:MAG TPA: zinc-ribbon domain-containing protein [Candidatus Eisenbacteria bacterium]|jgi:predicted Zn finger-like uncharacterized protein
MIVGCPHCGARYELPPRLLGPGGARVRCPRCAASFDVGPEGTGEPVPAPEPQAAPRPAPRRAEPVRSEAGPRATDRAPQTLAPAGRRHEDETHAETEATDSRALARQVLDELAARKGPAMEEARARGRLLSEFGPALAAAFDEYRRRGAGSGDPAPFREALHERWGIDLSPARAVH